MKTKKLSLFESIMLVAGSGIGTGILTIPYAINQVGIVGTLLALLLAFSASTIIYLYIADLTLHSKEENETLGILKEHLAGIKHQKLITTILFIVLTIVLLENLIVYILCATDIISDLFAIPAIVSKLIFYVLASIVIFGGIKKIGIGEKYSVSFITIVITTLMVLSFTHPQRSISLTFGKPSIVLAIFGLFMFAFSAIFSVIQVTKHIEKRDRLKVALMGGLAINALVTVFFAIAAIVGSHEVTEVATIGITNTYGSPYIKIACSIFVLLAMFSSYWSSGLAFADMVQEYLKIDRKKAWTISTIPTIILAIAFPLSILEYVQIGAGALSVMIGLTILPAYYHSIKNSNGPLLLGKLGKSKALLWLEGAAILIMAISSFISIS